MPTENTHTIWIVEDDPIFKESLEDLITMTDGFHLGHTANSVEKAIQAFGIKENPDIILEDIGLPGLSGIEAISIYKKLFPNVLIVILTIFDDDERVFEAIKAGADGYLLKRAPGSEIIHNLQQLIQGGATLSPPIAKKVMNMLVKPSQQKTIKNPLTKREVIITKYLVDGLTINEIADKLVISKHTVDTHTKNIYKKLHVHNRSNLATVAIKKGLI